MEQWWFGLGGWDWSLRLSSAQDSVNRSLGCIHLEGQAATRQGFLTCGGPVVVRFSGFRLDSALRGLY